jgi:hypothetical protein
MLSAKKENKSQTNTISTAEAFYVVFRSLPKKDQLAIVKYILADEDIHEIIALSKIPNETTLKTFSEDKSSMPLFYSIEELKKDLLS